MFAWSEIYHIWMRKSHHPGYANTTERALDSFKVKCNWRSLECRTELCREKIIHVLQFLIIMIKSLFRTNKVNFPQILKGKALRTEDCCSERMCGLTGSTLWIFFMLCTVCCIFSFFILRGLTFCLNVDVLSRLSDWRNWPFVLTDRWALSRIHAAWAQ